MNLLFNFITGTIFLLTPLGLGYAWVFYVRRMSEKTDGWRRWTTLAVLVLISLVVLMWPISEITAPRVNWHTWEGAGAYWSWVDTGKVAALRILLGATVLSFLARPRLIAPLVTACLGTALLWISRMP